MSFCGWCLWVWVSHSPYPGRQRGVCKTYDVTRICSPGLCLAQLSVELKDLFSIRNILGGFVFVLVLIPIIIEHPCLTNSCFFVCFMRNCHAKPHLKIEFYLISGFRYSGLNFVFVFTFHLCSIVLQYKEHRTQV